MAVLDAKLARDLWRTKSQLGAIVLVIACGTGLFLGMRATMRSLEAAQRGYYAAERFGHVFAQATRAPEQVAEHLRRIPGVEAVQTRVIGDVTVDVPEMIEAASARLVSIPDRGEPLVDGYRLRSGRPPDPLRDDEALASEPFAEAHALRLGTRLPVVLDGRRRLLRIVGTALAPEFTYSVPPGALLPDDRRFGILWMRRRALAPAFDLDGAFNDVGLRVAPGASVGAVKAAVDRELARYGGLGAYGRDEQPSHAFLQSELDQLRTFGSVVPMLFLAVAAFLLSIVLGRIVTAQREPIAVLKALGRSDAEIGLHYAKLAGVVVGAGTVVGVLVAVWLGDTMCRLYLDYYRFPELPFRLAPGELWLAIGLTFVAAALGTFGAIRRTVRLEPAAAMRPQSPAVYRPTLIERIGLSGRLPHAVRAILRELERRPGRAAMSILGVAMSTSLVVMSSFVFEAFDLSMQLQFGLERRDAMQLTLAQPRDLGALASLEQLPGVRRAEPVRIVPVRFRSGSAHRNGVLTGLPVDGTLQRVLDADTRVIPIPADGIVLSRRLAWILGVAPGDTVEVDVLDGARPRLQLTIARLAETWVGLSAWVSLEALGRALGEAPTLNVALLDVDAAHRAELHRAAKDTPLVQGVAERSATLVAYRRMVDENLGRSTLINLSFALVLALGVLYNTARVTADERARELASLRVLGFTKGEVATLLLGELALLTALGLPLGLLLGRLSVTAMADNLATDQFRIPDIVAPRTFALAALTVIAATVVAAWAARRRVDRLDLIEVLKAHD
ncbi:MAG: ABC transporter permease [Planctomycetes bacterium]|nr:ABC transporter permease [Planctomycetota bacterium]